MAVLPLTLQIVGVDVLKLTGKPELALAESVMGRPISAPPLVVRAMVCVAWTIGND